MKLKSFRIKNYKSISDSRECILSDNDNITILAGQNESGKSSILQALRDFENETIKKESYRDDETLPEIECKYTIEKDDFDIEDIFSFYQLPESFKKIINNIKELKVIKVFDLNLNVKINLDKDLEQQFVDALNKHNSEILKDNGTLTSKGAVNEYEIESTIDEVVEALFNNTPKIIFFDDFCDLLPDQILIKVLKDKKTETPGYQAVKNIETILNADFSSLDDLTDGRRAKTQNTYHKEITAQFNEKWKQKISDGNGAKIHIIYNQGKAFAASYLNFFIETKESEFLTPTQRSQGFKWFLSFFLHLKAESERVNNLIILFDEPGLYLHSKAQADMISVFEELANNNQIIYSTHSPYLIDTSKIHRLRIILNTKKDGTTIEKITTNKIQNQKDSFKPIIDAIGLEVTSSFSVGEKNNVILEGISDFHYFRAMKKILNKEYPIGMLPSMGASNCHLLMELCIGWGLNWVIIFDDKGATKDYNKIKKYFFHDNEEESSKHIYKIRDCDGIEDAFTVSDMKLVNQDADFSRTQKNSETVQNYGGKELYARLFFEKVLKGEITKEKLSKSTISNFEKIFGFIETSFNIKNAIS